MITISCSKDLYTYNAYHLAKAFFPEQKAKVFTDPSKSGSVIFDINGKSIFIPEYSSKDEVDKNIYSALSTLTGKTLPWGLLTGVRPVKPAMAKLKQGMGKEEFVNWYGKEKLVSKEKAALAFDIAKAELNILNEIRGKEGGWEDTASIYIGIPFCPSICSYCSFSLGTVSRYADKTDDYIKALCREIEGVSKLCKGKSITSIYIGGGTPGVLSPAQLEELMQCIAENIDTGGLKEFCFEAGRPDTITKEKLDILKKYRVNRICVNPQTMQQKTLDKVGRKYETGKVYEAFDAARQAGFDNINMDLIAGLPGECRADMADTLEKVLALSPDSLTVHALSIKRRAAMESINVPADEVIKMTDLAYEKAKAAGMKAYYLYRQKNIAGNFENLGYAKPGKEGLYNILTMEEVQTIFGLGAGADTKVVLKEAVPNPARGGKAARILRCSNIKDVDGYINNIEEMMERKELLLRSGGS